MPGEEERIAAGQPRSPKERAAELFREEGGKKEEENRWVEIRIPDNPDLERRNLYDLYDWIHAETSGEEDVFEVAIVGMESSEGEGLRVRYFMRAPDFERRRGLWNQLEGEEVSPYKVEEPLDFSAYELEAEFEMEDDFAVPLVPLSRIDREKFPRTPKRLASALKDGGALRIAIRRDDDAANDIQKFINKEEGKTRDPLTIVMGIFDNVVAGRTHDGVPEARRERPRQKEETDYSRLAKDRRDLNHVHCEFRAYGDENQLRGIVGSFNFVLNNIVELNRGKPESNQEEIKEKIKDKLGTVSKLVKTVSETEEDLRGNLEETENLRKKENRKDLGSTLSTVSDALTDASKAAARASETLKDYREENLTPNRPSKRMETLLKASLILPFLLPLALAFLGAWSPASILESASAWGFILSSWPFLVPTAVTVGSWLWFFGGRARPIVLSVHELSVMASLPSKPETLPVEFEPLAPPSFGEEKPEGEREEEGELEEREPKEEEESVEEKPEEEREEKELEEGEKEEETPEKEKKGEKGSKEKEKPEEGEKGENGRKKDEKEDERG